MSWKWTMGTIAVALSVAATGCSKAAKISVSANTAQGVGTAQASLDAGNGIEIERIRVVIRKVELEAEDALEGLCLPDDDGEAPPATGSVSGALVVAHDRGDDGSGGGTGSGRSGDDDDDLDDDCEDELEAGPFLVDLAGAELDDGVHFVADFPVPAGTYDEIEFKVNTINAQKAARAPVLEQREGLAEMAEKHASILVDGTMDGAPFEFSTPIEVKHEREGEIVVAEGDTTALTLDIDPAGWFKAADGSKLDPTDPTALGAILANIRASIRVEHDDDRDGCDDDVDPACDDDDDDGPSP